MLGLSVNNTHHILRFHLFVDIFNMNLEIWIRLYFGATVNSELSQGVCTTFVHTRLQVNECGYTAVTVQRYLGFWSSQDFFINYKKLQ